jgi:hypothetical protein
VDCLFVCLVNESLIQRKNVYVWDVVLYIYILYIYIYIYIYIYGDMAHALTPTYMNVCMEFMYRLIIVNFIGLTKELNILI